MASPCPRRLTHHRLLVAHFLAPPPRPPEGINAPPRPLPHRLSPRDPPRRRVRHPAPPRPAPRRHPRLRELVCPRSLERDLGRGCRGVEAGALVGHGGGGGGGGRGEEARR